MRSVQVIIRVHDVDAAAAYERVGAFNRYAELSEVIRSVTSRQVNGTEEVSDWDVYFRNGILSWSETDLFDRENLTITFEQIDGDFAEFAGVWRLTADGQDCLVDFSAEFDFGIPSLAGILDPVAERVFKETIARVVISIFGGNASVVGDEAVARAVAEVTGAPATAVSGAR
ncbi:type II toxin-antitoxin system RatA family toxin [Streptomyces sp. NPDC101062]|uniref:type II toxin-antitoxin system RatA family toxin n=1 Tax=unclassified Streptomyces TaxID=2593676 RepID=UPI002E7709A3|nr:SRPBCC family protein [Streptomyces sp. JV176]MEE1802542.1 SRPBCC family protein [Streptomyces sp. JV176]